MGALKPANSRPRQIFRPFGLLPQIRSHRQIPRTKNRRQMVLYHTGGQSVLRRRGMYARLGHDFSNPPTDARTSTSPTRATAFEGREKFYEDLNGDKYILLTEPFKRSYFDKPAKSFNFYARNVDLKYGGRDRQKLLKILFGRVSRFGINLGGHLSESDTLHDAKIPYTVTCNSAPEEWIETVKGWWQSPPDWFSPKFEKSVKEALAKRRNL